MTATEPPGAELAAPARPARRVFKPEDGAAPADAEHERSYLLALLAVLWPSFIGPDPEAEGYSRLVIALPTGTAAWAIPALDRDLFDHVLPMPAEAMGPAELDAARTYRAIWDLTIGRVSIAEQAAGVRAAERARLRGALNATAQMINTSDGPAYYVPWAEVERALTGAAIDPAEQAAGVRSAAAAGAAERARIRGQLREVRVSCRCHGMASVHWRDLEAALDGGAAPAGGVTAPA